MKAQTFRLKVEAPMVRAVQFVGSNGREIAKWVGGKSTCEHPDPEYDALVHIETSQGLVKLDTGEMVVETGAGTFLVMTHAEFDAMYEHAY